jgi:hypothetical protein
MTRYSGIARRKSGGYLKGGRPAARARGPLPRRTESRDRPSQTGSRKRRPKNGRSLSNYGPRGPRQAQAGSPLKGGNIKIHLPLGLSGKEIRAVMEGTGLLS